MTTQAPIRFSSNESYAPKAYNPPSYTSGTYEQPYQPSYQPAYVSTGYPADNRNTTFVGAPDARNTYTVVPTSAHPRVSFNHPGTAYAPVNTVYQQPTTKVTGSTAPVQLQAQPSSYVRETVRETEVRHPQGHVVRAPAPSGLKQDDDFLCGRTGWIIGALIALLLLALALSYGLGAFGGNGSNATVAAPAASASATPNSGANTSGSTASGNTAVSANPAASSAGSAPAGSSTASPATGSVAPKSVAPVAAHDGASIHSRHLNAG